MSTPREGYRSLFLDSLRDSPAWDLFCRTMLQGMSFLQDDVQFRMNGVPQTFTLRPEYLNGTKLLLGGNVYRVLYDCHDVELQATNCLISNNGYDFKQSVTVGKMFWIKPKSTCAPEDIEMTCLNFYPNHLNARDMKILLQYFGLESDEVEFSAFDTMFTATSPYNVNHVLVRSEIPYEMQYLYDDGSGVEVTGIKQETVRQCIKIRRVEGNQFYYDTQLTLIPNKDSIVTESGTYLITSVNKNTLTCSAPEAEGYYDIFRNEYIVPLYPDEVLLSALELTFNAEDADQANRFIPRVTPVRCIMGYRGQVDVRVRSYINLIAEFALPNWKAYSDIKLLSEISFQRNNKLYQNSSRVIDIDAEVFDYHLDEATYEEIQLE